MATATSESAVRDVRQQTYSPGLEGVIAGESALCLVDEGESGLLYRGYRIGDLAEYGTFEEVAYLLFFGELPTARQLKDFSSQTAQQAFLPRPVVSFLESARLLRGRLMGRGRKLSRLREEPDA